MLNENYAGGTSMSETVEAAILVSVMSSGVVRVQVIEGDGKEFDRYGSFQEMAPILLFFCGGRRPLDGELG